jgi:hypothetical protein
MELKSWSDHDFEERNKNPSLISKFTVPKTQQEWKEEQQRPDDYYHAQLVHLLSDADALRVALRNKLPKEAQTVEDDVGAASFTKALVEGSAVQSGLNCCPPSIAKAADYLDSLAKRVSRIETLKN